MAIAHYNNLVITHHNLWLQHSADDSSFAVAKHLPHFDKAVGLVTGA